MLHTVYAITYCVLHTVHCAVHNTQYTLHSAQHTQLHISGTRGYDIKLDPGYRRRAQYGIEISLIFSGMHQTIEPIQIAVLRTTIMAILQSKKV